MTKKTASSPAISKKAGGGDRVILGKTYHLKQRKGKRCKREESHRKEN